jgi:rhodanese-related sulfurtransferase
VSDRPPPGTEVPSIAASDLKELLAAGQGGLHVLDTRPRAEYERGHVPGSLHCEVHELSKRDRELPPKAATVVVVGEAGRRGQAGAVFLLLAGHGSVLLLRGGWPAWDGAVETGPGRPLASSRPAKPPGWTDPPKR